MDGSAIGIIPVGEAIEKAIRAGLDLVEVAPNAEPPVCRIMNYGKFKYEKAKKEKEAKKKQHIVHLKEIKLHPKTELHDYSFKVDHARKFLLKGDRVKVTVVFRGREIAYTGFGREILDRIDNDLIDLSQCEMKEKLEGRNMISMYVPDKVKIKAYLRKLEKEKKEAEENLEKPTETTI